MFLDIHFKTQEFRIFPGQGRIEMDISNVNEFKHDMPPLPYSNTRVPEKSLKPYYYSI